MIYWNDLSSKELNEKAASVRFSISFAKIKKCELSKFKFIFKYWHISYE